MALVEPASSEIVLQCVQWHMPFLLTEEASDPGVAQVYTDLMSSGGHGNTCSTRLPSGFAHATVGECQTFLGRTFGSTLLAVRDATGLTVSPGLGRAPAGHTTVYYAARARIEADRLAAR